MHIEAEAVVEALHRLHAGDAHASRELELFQAWPGAQAVSFALLKSAVVEVQFFAACTICRIAKHGVFDMPSSEGVTALLMQACGCAHRPAARQLVAAAVTLAGPGGARELAGMSLNLLRSEAHWWLGVDILMALSPPPSIEGVCECLGNWLGRGSDELIFSCALRYPTGVCRSPVGVALEEAIRHGHFCEEFDVELIPAEFRSRMAVGAVQAIQNGHLDEAASVLQGLKAVGSELLEPAAQLLNAPMIQTRMTAIKIWSNLISGLAKDQIVPAFERFAANFFASAALPAEHGNTDEDEVARFREALWHLSCDWKLATSQRLNLVGRALDELKQSLQGGGDWRRAEAALWALSKSAKSHPADAAQAQDVCVVILQQLASTPGLAPLAVAACKLIEEAPCTRALPSLLDKRLVDLQLRGADVRSSVASSICACCTTGSQALWADGAAEALAAELQARALAGEDGLVSAAAQLLVVKDIRPLAAQWAHLCSQATPDTIGARAKAFFSTIICPEVCSALWNDCAKMHQYLPSNEQVMFVERAASFVATCPGLLVPTLEIWKATWMAAEGEEALISALGQLVRASARSSAAAASCVEILVNALASAHCWCPHALDAAIAVIEVSLAPAGSLWPLTNALAPAFGLAIVHLATIIGRGQHVEGALPLLAALVSWSREASSEFGQAMRACLLAREAAIRVIMANVKDSDKRLADRLGAALGINVTACT